MNLQSFLESFGALHLLGIMKENGLSEETATYILTHAYMQGDEDGYDRGAYESDPVFGPMGSIMP